MDNYQRVLSGYFGKEVQEAKDMLDYVDKKREEQRKQ